MEETEDIWSSDNDSMQTPATRKRVKRLLRLLKNQQFDDTILTPATVMSFKYLLPYNSLCTRVRVKFPKDPVTGRKEDAFIRYEKPRGEYSEYIISQLEAWKITDPDNKDTVVVPKALDIFLDCVVYDFEGEKAYPTVITWPCPLRHRTLYFFAYLNFAMPSGHYTIPELLALRQKGEASRELLLKALKPERELAALFPGAMLDPQGFLEDVVPNDTSLTEPVNLVCRESTDDKQATQHGDDSSTSSEEVLFKGTARRRQAASRETVESRQAQPKGEVGWKYSGRNESDPSATEPLSAPTGLPAQKSEGFQRFYKAVVSPTHVRVTAGGRIVPNTRGLPSSPTLKRAQEGSVAGSNGGHEKTTRNAIAAGLSMPAGMAQHIPPVMPPFFPGYGHPGFPPYGPQMPFYPMPYGHPMAPGYPPFPYPMPMMRQPSVDSALKDTLNLKTGDGQVDNGDDPHKASKVPTAPASQFDQRRPFFFNGQWMYPMPGAYPPPPPGAMGGPYMPMPMPMPMHMPMSMAGGPVPPTGPRMPASTQPSQLGSPIKFTGPVAPQAQARAMSVPAAMMPAVPAVSGIQAPPAPPISSIRPSEITRKQIGIFRKSLKYHEDQLQYNRHQIDEKDTEQKIQKYRDDIARFECMMQAQIDDEKKRGYPPLSEKDKSPEVSSETGQGSTSVSEDAAANGISAVPSTAALAPPVAAHNSLNSNAKATNNSSRSPSGQLKDDATKASGLPTGAALAPPFEPRKDLLGASTAADRTNPMWTVPAYPKQGIDGIYQQATTESWEAAVSRLPPPVFTTPAGQAFDANVTSVTSKGYPGVPYLIGSLPKGMNPRTAKDIDYQYSRELTEDELRARHLYWGKVPRSAVRGLPKYDGRNFYPPSPVKDTTNDNPVLETSGDLIEFTPKPVGTKPDAQSVRPSTPVGSALIPVDSADHAQQNGEDGIYTSTELATGASKPGSAKGKSEAGFDSASVMSHDRRSEKPGGARLWEAMLKKGSSAALSSTTAEGKLQPQYAGSAAASLSPTINRTSDRPASGSPGKDSIDNSDGGALLSPAPESQGTDSTPSGGATHEQLADNGGPSVPAAVDV